MPNRHALAVNLLEGVWLNEACVVSDEVEWRQRPKHIRPDKGRHKGALFGLWQVRPHNALQHGARATKGEMMRLNEMIERLSELERQHGNVEVYLIDEDKDWYKDISNIEFTDWDGRDRVVLK